MCVIMTSQHGVRLTDDQIRAGFEENKWGAGVAWIDQEKIGKSNKTRPIVRWKKGIQTPEEVIELYKSITGPYVVHFRIPTEGLEDIELTHPFPISAEADTSFEGSTYGKVLFHNGGWTDWRNWCLSACKDGVKLPRNGMVNDSRMMAWAAHHFGDTVLQLINEKAIVFGLNEDGSLHFEMYGTGKTNGWYFKGDRTTVEGVWFSNDRWEKHLPKKADPPRGPITNLRQIKDLVRGGHGGDRRHGDFRQQPVAGGSSLSGSDTQPQGLEGGEGSTALPTGGDGKLVNSPEFIAKMAQVHPDEDQLAWALHYNPKRYATTRVVGFLGRKEMVH